MRLTFLSIILSLLALSVSCAADAQDFKKVPEMRRLIRQGKSGDAQKLLGDYFKGQKTDSLEYNFLSGLYSHHLFDKVNEKLYLNNKVDTTEYYKNLLNMYTSFSLCYDKIKEQEKYSKIIDKAILSHPDNLIRGGNWHIQKGDYDNSLKFYSICRFYMDRGLISYEDSVSSIIYLNGTISAYRKQDWETVENYASKAISLGLEKEEIYLMYSEALANMNREEEWIKEVDKAIRLHPDQFYFYSLLINYYLKKEQTGQALKYAEELVSRNPDHYLNNFVMGYVYEKIGDLQKAVTFLEKSNSQKGDYIACVSHLGHCYIQMAQNYSSSIQAIRLSQEQKDVLKGFYSKAMTHLEKCRKLAPKNKNLWLEPLYKVYYELNEGEKLDELEELMN